MKISPPGRTARSAAFLAIVVGLLTFGSSLLAQQGGGIPLNPAHPDSYVVKKGDTLWDISAMFLRDPWNWPQIWYVNPQIENPHLIFPGDTLSLVYLEGKPQLQLQRGQGATGTERLSPQVREESLTAAIPTIPYKLIGPFLTKGVVMEKKEFENLPYVVAFREGHLAAATGNDAYVTGAVGGVGSVYSVVRMGEALQDPDDGAVLGYEGVYISAGVVRRGGQPATLTLNDATREAMKGDRLIVQIDPLPLQFEPRAPSKVVDGRIIHVVDGMTQIGQYHVIVINRGTRDGLEAGSVLSVWQAGDKVPARANTGVFSRKVQLPDELAGTVMVFRAYDRISYALVMRAEGPMHVLDKVRNPG